MLRSGQLIQLAAIVLRESHRGTTAACFPPHNHMRPLFAVFSDAEFVPETAAEPAWSPSSIVALVMESKGLKNNSPDIIVQYDKPLLSVEPLAR